MISDTDDPGSAGQLQPLRLEEPAGRVGAGQHAELRVPDHHHRAAPQLPAGVLPEHLGAALRPHHQRRRRTTSSSAPSTCAGTTPGSGSCCRAASSSSIRPRPTWPGGSRRTPRTTRRGGISPASTRRWGASTRTSATGPSTSRGRRIALWIGDTWKINNSLTINGGLRWDADFGALDPPHITTDGDLRSAAGLRRQYRPPAGRSPLSGRPARHRQHRPARRLHLERRRQRHLRRPRRQRPLLQHPRLEHDLQPPVVQRRAHPGELVPQRRPAGLHRQPDPRHHRGRHPERPRAAAGAVAAGDRQRLPDAPHLAEQRRLPDPVRPAVGRRRRPDPLEGLQLRPPARSEPGLQPGQRLQPGADPGQPAGSRSSGRSSGSSRPARPTTWPCRAASPSATRATGRRR